jgi:hypothetical protein
MIRGRLEVRMLNFLSLVVLIVIASLLIWSSIRAWRQENRFLKWGGTGLAAHALIVAGDGFFNSRRVQLAMLAVRHAIPATYSVRDYPKAGGLISYGTSFADNAAFSSRSLSTSPRREPGRRDRCRAARLHRARCN